MLACFTASISSGAASLLSLTDAAPSVKGAPTAAEPTLLVSATFCLAAASSAGEGSLLVLAGNAAELGTC